MKLKFDSSQEYQLKAIASIVDIFKGHGYSDGFFTPFYDPERLIPDTIAYRNEPVNGILLRKNIRSIQERNGLEVTEYSGKHFRHGKSDPAGCSGNDDYFVFQHNFLLKDDVTDQ